MKAKKAAPAPANDAGEKPAKNIAAKKKAASKKKAAPKAKAAKAKDEPETPPRTGTDG